MKIISANWLVTCDENSSIIENGAIVFDDKIIEIIKKVFDLRPGAIIRDLDLRRPLYKQTAAYGHFGRTDIDVPWEKTNKVDEIKSLLG